MDDNSETKKKSSSHSPLTHSLRLRICNKKKKQRIKKMIRQPLTKVEIALNQQRLTGEFCDVTIFCGTEVRFAHRCVIASASEAWDF